MIIVVKIAFKEIGYYIVIKAETNKSIGGCNFIKLF